MATPNQVILFTVKQKDLQKNGKLFRIDTALFEPFLLPWLMCVEAMTKYQVSLNAVDFA